MFRKAIVWNWELKKSQVREILMRLAKNNPKPNQNLAGAASLHLIYFVQFVTRRQGNWQQFRPHSVTWVTWVTWDVINALWGLDHFLGLPWGLPDSLVWDLARIGWTAEDLTKGEFRWVNFDIVEKKQVVLVYIFVVVVVWISESCGLVVVKIVNLVRSRQAVYGNILVISPG